MASRDVSHLTFALMDYERRGWGMPAVHVRIYDWLERTEGARVRVLRVFRGCGKSTILGIRNANKFRRDPLHQLLVQGADDDLAHDISRDTMAVLEAHPLCHGLLRNPAGVEQWWSEQGWESNRRTPQFRGKGILSRTTGNRADEIQNDDVEVEKNVTDDKARKKLRKKLSEQTHILKPDGSRLYVGTPHAHDSLYDELIKAGAEHLTIPLFATQTRYTEGTDKRTAFAVGADPGPDGVWVFLGIGAPARLAVEGLDYTLRAGVVHFDKPPGVVVDICTGNAWPERFHRKEMEYRRKECRTLNEWDSQYQLQAKPLTEVRLDPDKIPVYDCEPRFDTANRKLRMWLGSARIAGAALHWDPSSAKPKSDVSALALILQDDAGRRYWHRAIALKGEVAEYANDGKTIIGGQVAQICDVVEKFGVRRIKVETNGAGTFAPTVLRSALVQRGLQCGVQALHESRNKNKTILEAFEPLISSGMLWAHVSVADGEEGGEGPAFAEMRQWSPAVTEQPDDYLDSGAKAILDTPERIEMVGKPTATPGQDWRPTAGVYEAELSL